MGFTNAFVRNNFLSNILYREVSDLLFPAHIIRSISLSRVQVPIGITAKFAVNHVVLKDLPWYSYVEWPTLLTGFNYSHFSLLKPALAKIFNKPNCKGIITWCEPAERALHLSFDQFGLQRKISRIPLAVPPRPLRRTQSKDYVQLLFVGSVFANNAFDFYLKGGRELLIAFDILSAEFDNIRLVIKATVPTELLSHCRKNPKLKVISDFVSWTEMEGIYSSSDVFVFPAHNTVWSSILEAMSYGLPVVATDVYANNELVKDGDTGLLISGSSIPFYADSQNSIPIRHTRKRLLNERQIRSGDEGLVKGIVEKLRLLVIDRKERQRMGRNAYEDVVSGDHSIVKRNKILGELFERTLG